MERGYDRLIQLHKSGNNRMDTKNNIYAKKWHMSANDRAYNTRNIKGRH